MRCNLILPLLIVLGACQPIPRPFEHPPGDRNALLQLPEDSGGIVVAPVAGAPAGAGGGLADGMVAAMIDLGIPAYAEGGNRASMTLVGEVVDPGPDGRIEWILRAPDGAEIGRHAQRIGAAPAELWANADPALLKRLAQDAAPQLAAHIRGGQAAEVLPPAIYVGAVRGAPDEDGRRLQAALRQGLRRLGARVAAAPGGTALMATSEVSMTETGGGRTEIAIAWAVSDPHGTEIGTIEQASTFAKSAVDERWGEIAREAGLAAAAGMVELVSRIDWSGGFVTPQADAEKPAR